MAEEIKKSENLANQDEKETKAPAVSYAQLKMMNTSLQNQNIFLQRAMLEISEAITEQSAIISNANAALMNTAQNIKNLFKPKPQPEKKDQQTAKQEQPK